MLHMHSPCLNRPWGLCLSFSSLHNMFSHILGMLHPCSRPPIITSTHTACPHAAHKVIAISPLALVHAFNQPPLANTLHTTFNHQNNPALPRTQATKSTHKKLATKPPMSCTTTQGQQHLLLPLITAHKSNSNREIRQVPFKETLGVWHEEL